MTDRATLVRVITTELQKHEYMHGSVGHDYCSCAGWREWTEGATSSWEEHVAQDVVEAIEAEEEALA